jgi:hypothetical protein
MAGTIAWMWWSSEGSIMSAILDLLYREYCGARLAEMRKQLLLSVANDEIPVANWDASLDDQSHSLGDDISTKKQNRSGNRVL